MATSFFVGDRVVKRAGYDFPGIVVAVFNTLAGKERFVVEYVHQGEPPTGMLHIFNAEQLDLFWDNDR